MKVQLICDDDRSTNGLSRLLADLDGEFEMMGSSATSAEGVERAGKTRPDIVILDLESQNAGSMETIRSLVQPLPPVRVLLYSTDMESSVIARALAAGASGVISSETRERELYEALRAIRSGQVYLSREIAQRLEMHRPTDIPPTLNADLAGLTPRERQVLQRLADGQSSKEVAHDLGISSKTVDTHRRNLMRKLNAGSIADLVKHAIRAGLTTLEPSDPAPGTAQ